MKKKLRKQLNPCKTIQILTLNEYIVYSHALDVRNTKIQLYRYIKRILDEAEIE